VHSDGPVDKEDMGYKHSGGVIQHEKQSFVICRKMVEMEIIILSKITQVQKAKHHIFTPRGSLGQK
jgi:hypothetical protein